MTFIIQGLNGAEIMPLEKLFKPAGVAKTEAITASRPIDEEERHDVGREGRQAGAERAYRTVSELPQGGAVLFAQRIMSTPVVSLAPETTVDETLNVLRQSRFRHLPVVSESGRLVGIVSDRDILHYAAGLGDNYRPQRPRASSARVELLMKTPVLTASPDTDVRHVARLLVARRVGAMPIVEAGGLAGIITRNDILNAVMSNFVLELWA